MFQYRVSVIIPVYNAAEFLKPCLDSLMEQTMKPSDFEVLLVDDGSTDNSGEICKDYEQRSPIFRFFPRENGGVSSARNFGIEHAKGKYFFYLDSDDTITPDALKTIADFFDRHYDEVDMVTYPIVPMRGEKRLAMHYRYQILKETGVYDLENPDNWYITQTTMNICVKNFGEGNNRLFDTTLRIHEDQKYISEILFEKKKIGFCKKPEYHYMMHAGSAIGSKMYAYYIFEDTTALWEHLFAKCNGRIPAYLQAIYLHDINWKHVSDLLLPYHYEGKDFERAKSRLMALINQIDDKVILNHPVVDFYNKLFLMKIKHGTGIQYHFDSAGIHMEFDSQEIYFAEHPTIVVDRFKVLDDVLHFDAFIKCPVFLYSGKPKVYLTLNGERREIEVMPSANNYYHARIETASFWRIRLDLDVNDLKSFSIEVEAGGYTYTPEYYFMPNTAFHQNDNHPKFYKNGRCYSLKNNIFKITDSKLANSPFAHATRCVQNFFRYFFENPKIVLYRSLSVLGDKKHSTWLYLDRYGVFDNAYTQFKHDFQIKDGIKRYYVLNQCDWNQLHERFSPEEIPYVIPFRGFEHRKLYLTCDKIITSFSNLSNICPFGIKPIRWYSDLAQYELVYLQHGILHASLLNMYAKERCIIDRVVVSSGFEVSNFTGRYGYALEDLIQSGMPRYDEIHLNANKQNRILFSPSWRSNLIGKLVENQRESIPDIFVASDFYQEVSGILNSEKLADLLEKYDLYLDFKNHPIFACYNDLFHPCSDRITVSCGNTQIDQYKLMITDYSSIVFDAVYQQCPIIYFVPDYDKFKAGVSHNYRELDLPLEDGFGPFTKTADQLIEALTTYVENGFVPSEPYAERMANFFLHQDDHCCDRLYEDMK